MLHNKLTQFLWASDLGMACLGPLFFSQSCTPNQFWTGVLSDAQVRESSCLSLHVLWQDSIFVFCPVWDLSLSLLSPRTALSSLPLWLLYLAAYSIKSSQNQSVSSVAQSFPTLCDPMNHSTPGLPVHHKLPHVHRVSDAIQPSHPLSSPSPPALNPSQRQGGTLFQWVNSSHEVAKVLEFQLQHQSFQWTSRTDLL